MASQSFTHLLAGLVLLARIGDVVSTRLATPRLRLEANALVRRLGWPFACATLLVALVPYAHHGAGIAVLTASLLVTASNLSRGWTARALGEEEYFALLLRAARRSRRAEALAFAMGSAGCVALLGVLLLAFSGGSTTWAYWFGFGMVIYALAIGLHGSSFIIRVFRAAATPSHGALEPMDAAQDVDAPAARRGR